VASLSFTGRIQDPRIAAEPHCAFNDQRKGLFSPFIRLHVIDVPSGVFAVTYVIMQQALSNRNEKLQQGFSKARNVKQDGELVV
jgi:hypothetical protein